MRFVGAVLSRGLYRRVNVRVLLVVIVVTLLLGGTVYFVHGVQNRRHADRFLQEARQAREDGQTKEAIDHFGRYLKLVPDDPEAMAELGLLLAEVAPGRRAYELLERALLYEPQRVDVRRKLADLAIKMGRFSDARDHLENRLLISAPHDSELLEMLARCQVAQGELEQAAETLQSAIENAPDRVELYGYLADLFRRRLEKPDEASRWMDRVVEKNPDSAQAHVLRGNYLRSLGQTDDAAAEAVNALKLAPEDMDALALAARCALQKGQLEEARGHARRGLELDPKQARMYATLADIELKAKDLDKAADWLRRGLQEDPDQPALLQNLARLLIDSGQADEAQATVDKLRRIEQAEPLAQYLQARVDYLQGRWKAAAEGFDRARPGLSRWPDMHRDAERWLGRCYGRLGARDLQLAAFRRAVPIDRLWIPVRVELVEALLAAGELEEALKEQRSLMDLPGAPADSHARLAQMLMLENLQRDPAKRDWEEVQREIDAAAKAGPQAAEVTTLQASALVAQGRGDEAEKLLQKALAKTPQEASLWIMLAGLFEQREKWQRAEELLDEAGRKLGDSVALRLARAGYLVQRHKDQAAPSLRQLAQKSDGFSEEETLRLWRGLMGAHMRAGDFEEARRLCQKVAQKQPNDLPLRLLLFELALRTENRSGVQTALEEIRRIEGQGPLWHFGRAVQLHLAAAAGQKEAIPEALTHLDEAARLRPTWGRVPLVAGRVYDLAGDPKKALTEYRRAIDLGEIDPTAVRRVVHSMYAAQRYEEADELIRRLEKEQGGSLSGEFGRIFSDLSLRKGDFDRALQMARRTAADSKDYRDHLWLGQVLGVLGQRDKNEGRGEESRKKFDEAEKAFRQAVALADELPQTWIPLIHFLARTGKTNEAEKAILQAEGRIPADKATLAIARAYEILGNQARATGRYDAALAAAPNDPVIVRRVVEFYLRTGRLREAEKQLEKIASGDIPAQPADRVWARRRLALILADGGRRKEAIGVLEDLLKGAPGGASEDRFFLARLYLAEADWARARKLLHGLATSDSPQPRHLAAYVDALLDHDELAQAETWLARLEGSRRGDFLAVSLRARLRFEQGQLDRGIRDLKAFVEKPNVYVTEQAERHRLAAVWLEQFARTLKEKNRAVPAARLKREAEMMFRRYVADHPGEELFLVRFLGREGRLEEAMPLAQEAVEKAKPAAIAQMVAVLLSGRGAEDPEVLEAAEKILQSALEKHQRPVRLLMMLADVTTFQQRFDETEAIYREVIAKDGKNVSALNNLAVLLAHKQARLDEALELIQKAIDLAGPASTLLDSRATVYLARREFDKALADLERAIADVPRPTRYFHRAQVYYQTGQKKLAAESLKEAQSRDLKPEHLHQLERPAYSKLQAELLKP